MTKKKNIFALVLCGLLFLTFAVGSSSDKVPEEVEKGEITYKKVSIDTLEKDLENNAASAKEKYNNQYLEVSGKLGTIDSDLKYISLDSTKKSIDLKGIHCSLKGDEIKNKVKSLKKNQKITVRGKITDVGEVLGYYMDAYEIIVENSKK